MAPSDLPMVAAVQQLKDSLAANAKQTQPIVDQMTAINVQISELIAQRHVLRKQLNDAMPPEVRKMKLAMELVDNPVFMRKITGGQV